MANLEYRGTGRRKTSVARVRLVPGNGNIVVNKREFDEYFAYDTLKNLAKAPLEITNTLEKYDVIATIHGGGFTGQAGALRHGISRALVESDEELKPILKKEGFLTRDSRMKERYKYGRYKSRNSPHFSKR